MDVGYTNEDYVPIAAVTEIPSVLAVGADSEFADAEAFFAEAEANPGSLNVGVPGTTTSQAMELTRMAEEYDIERKFRETRLYQVAPISTNLVLSYLGEHVLGMPRSY